VAPSPQPRITRKRRETRLTYWPVYDFKPRAICTKGLTPAIFYGLIPLMFFARSAKQAGWIGAVVATLGTLSLVMGLIVFRSSI